MIAHRDVPHELLHVGGLEHFGAMYPVFVHVSLDLALLV